MLILRCVHVGQLPHPLPGAGLSGSCLSCEAPAQSQVQDDTRRNNNSGDSKPSSPGVSSRSKYPNVPVHTGLDAPASGPLSALFGASGGRRVSLSCALPASPRSKGDGRILGFVHLVPLGLGSVLLELHSQGVSPKGSRAQPSSSGATASASPKVPPGSHSRSLQRLAHSLWLTVPWSTLPLLVTPGSWVLHGPSCGSVQAPC